jgi:acyl-CoA reductase-like NAD-dependent aldehyde dehydrogenase
MSSEPKSWSNASPGNLAHLFPETHVGDVGRSVAMSSAAFPSWRGSSLEERRAALEKCRENLVEKSYELAALISAETGKPLREARLEMAASIAKFDLVFQDGEKHLRDITVNDGPHPASIRLQPRGPAAVIAPFNFPVHLGHGATVSYLLAGNTVIFKPSPLAANVGAAYAAAMQSALPEGVFEMVNGCGDIGRMLCLDPMVRSVCFTGSVPVGRSLARELAEDYSKSLALELGGKNTVVVCANADLDLAAEAVADGMCFTAGQRCNATSRVLVDGNVSRLFIEKLVTAIARYQPGDPLEESTTLGPLISFAAHERYERLVSEAVGDWILPGGILEMNDKQQHGYYVLPAVVLADDTSALDESPLATSESFAPILVIEVFDGIDQAITRHEAWPFGLTASVFTENEADFHRFGAHLSVGNLYHNLPTTFSPSTLPFGGWGISGNGHPGGRGFVRFAVQEQAVQWRMAAAK